MKPLIMVMLAAQVTIFFVTALIVVLARPTGERPRPIWSSLAIPLIIIAMASWNLSERHEGGAGADLLAYGSPLLLGMGIMACLMQIRRARGLDQSS